MLKCKILCKVVFDKQIILVKLTFKADYFTLKVLKTLFWIAQYKKRTQKVNRASDNEKNPNIKKNSHRTFQVVPKLQPPKTTLRRNTSSLTPVLVSWYPVPQDFRLLNWISCADQLISSGIYILFICFCEEANENRLTAVHTPIKTILKSSLSVSIASNYLDFKINNKNV